MNLPPVLRQRYLDANGNPLAGGKLYSYTAATTTPLATYTDQGGATPNANPIVLDANGECDMWLSPTLSYKFVLKDSNDVTQWTVDNVIGILTPAAVNTEAVQDAAITLAKLSATLGANQFLGANAAGTALEAKTISAGDYVTVTPSVGGLEISASGSSDSLVQQLDMYDSAVKAGETIAANTAICLDLNYQTYKYFLCDSDLPSRRVNFIGFSKAAATVTPGIYTWTGNADFVASNTITWTINGRSYSQVFSTDNDTTIAAIATQIASDADVASAVVTNNGAQDRIITITGEGGLSLTISTPSVTGGASQATIAIATTQAPNGDAVECHAYGPLTGFTGLVQGARYYLSSTAGEITNNPLEASPILVGQALSSTVLYVFLNPDLQFGASQTFVRALGSSSGETVGGASTNSEHFNFTSWSAGTADGTGYYSSQHGESILGGYLIFVDGRNLAGAGPTGVVRKYNKTSWSAGTNRTTAKMMGGSATVGSSLTIGGGSSDGSAAQAKNVVDTYNGTTWVAGAATMAATKYFMTAFAQGGMAHYVSGSDGGASATNTHYTYNGSTTSTSTAYPSSNNYVGGGSSGTGSTGISGTVAGATNTYSWNGSWSAAITISYTPWNLSAGSTTNTPATAYASSTGRAHTNGGANPATTSLTTTSTYNGSTWSADTASSTARSGAAGGVL